MKLQAHRLGSGKRLAGFKLDNEAFAAVDGKRQLTLGEAEHLTRARFQNRIGWLS